MSSRTDTDGTATDVRLGSAAAIRLVAERELRTKLRSKSFLVSTGLLLLLMVAFTGVMKFVSATGGETTVGVTSEAQALAEPLEATAANLGLTVTTQSVDSEDSARDLVDEGELDALLVGDGSSISVVVQEEIDSDLENALNVLAGQVALNTEIAELGGDPADVSAAVAEAEVNVEALQPPPDYNPEQLVIGMVAGVLIYISLLTAGMLVAQGVVEEKASRVVELLLSTIRPWQLMAGKVLGIGAVGLLQVVVLGLGGVIAAVALDVLTIPAATVTSSVVWLIVWYLLGFFTYALVFAASAALVSRQEDVGSVTTPVMMVIIVGYVIGISVLPSDPNNRLVEVVSLIPLFSPTVMPMRLAIGGVPAWQAALSVALVLALIPALLWLAGRMYNNAVMRTGARVKLRDALKAA